MTQYRFTEDVFGDLDTGQHRAGDVVELSDEEAERFKDKVESVDESDSAVDADQADAAARERRDDAGGDPLRPNDLVLGVPDETKLEAPVRFPHQVAGVDERAITPEGDMADERSDRPVVVENPETGETATREEDVGAGRKARTAARETPGEKR